MRNNLALLAFLSSLSACSTIEAIELPQLSLPAVWEIQTDQKSPVTLGEATLWQGLGDATLAEMLKAADRQNLDVKIAVLRLAEARAQAARADDERMPRVDVRAESSRGNKGDVFSGKAMSIHDIGLDASWELDIFGQNRARLNAANAEAIAREAEWQDVRLSLQAEIAQAYIALRAAQQQKQLARQALQAARTSLQLTQSLEKAGIVSGLDSTRAAREVARYEAAIPNWKADIATQRLRLRTLLGGSDEAFAEVLAKPAKIPHASAELVMGTPAQLLAQRPDIRARAAQLAAQSARVEEALAAQFPKLSLGAFYGGRDTSTLPSGDVWNLAAQFVAPILSFGRIEAAIDAADARQKQAALAYQQAVITALEEVEGQLVQSAQAANRAASLDASLRHATDATRLAGERYQRGISDYLEVLEAMQSQFAIANETVQAQANASTRLTALYKALGGDLLPATAQNTEK